MSGMSTMRGTVLNDWSREGRMVDREVSKAGAIMKTEAEGRTAKYQKLSLAEAAKFDDGLQIRPSAWSVVCKDRAVRGVSRSVRIRGQKRQPEVVVNGD